MAQVQNAQTPTMAGRYPKRKRAQVDYYEQDVDADIINVEEAENQDVEEYSQPKKRKSTAHSKPLPKRKIFPFMELPAEIRNMIYGYCFTDPAGIYLSSTTKKFRRTVVRVPEQDYKPQPNWGINDDSNDPNDSDDEEKEKEKEKEKENQKPSTEVQPLVPALLAVCKQIYQEGHDILYDNDFYLGDTLVMHSFLVDIGPRAASLLKNVTLIRWGEGRGVHKAYNHAGFAALSPATNLEKFKMHGYMCWRSDPMSVARQFYRDAFPWLEAVGAANGKVDAACDVVEIMCDTFSGSGYYRWNSYGQNSGCYKNMSGFREELSKLLNQRMKTIRS